MVKIVGYQRKTGTFEGVAYDNHIIYLNDNSDSKVVGFSVGQLKVKTENLQDIFGTNDLSKFIDKPVSLEYSIKNTSAVLVKVSLVKFN